MKPDRESILSRTNSGINIYAYVLRQYYPGQTVLSLSGRDCQPARNPFNEGKATLLVSIADGCAQHEDAEQAIAPGNAFDFAQLHFGIQGQELLNRLNDELHLRIGQTKRQQPTDQEPQQFVAPASPKVETPVFSYFHKPVSNTHPTRLISLTDVYQLIKGETYAACTSALRNLQDAKEARKYKARNFDYVTFSGTFSKRNDANLQKHSGLITIDFDHIADLPLLREKLLDDPYFETQLLFISPSGDGLKWVIPADLSRVKHQDFFRAVANYVQHAYKLEVDQSGKDVSRACFLPHDADVFIHPKFL